jgi:transcriptional regulator with XRE-family HTH domain
MEATLDIEVRRLLEARKGDWQSVAAKTDVSYSWLSKFFNGHIENPGYQTLKKLHEYLVAAEASADAAGA